MDNAGPIARAFFVDFMDREVLLPLRTRKLLAATQRALASSTRPERSTDERDTPARPSCRALSGIEPHPLSAVDQGRTHHRRWPIITDLRSPVTEKSDVHPGNAQAAGREAIPQRSYRL